MVSSKPAQGQKLGLRERKKADTHKRILQKASVLFERHGYPATSMEAIAAAADLSATTLYNYFGTKGQILLAMIARSDEELMQAEKSMTFDAGRTAADQIAGFLSRLTRHSLERIDKGTWRYAIAHTLISENTEDIKEGYGRINAKLLSYVVSVLEDLRDKGFLPVEDPKALGEMIFDMYRALFIRFISTETLSEQDHAAAMHRYVSAAIGDETRKK